MLASLCLSGGLQEPISSTHEAMQTIHHSLFFYTHNLESPVDLCACFLDPEKTHAHTQAHASSLAIAQTLIQLYVIILPFFSTMTAYKLKTAHLVVVVVVDNL